MQVILGYGSKRIPLQFPDGAPVSVSAVLRSLGEAQPAVYRAWCDSHGQIRRSLSVFVNSEHVRYRQGLDTTLSDGDLVYVIPLLAGG